MTDERCVVCGHTIRMQIFRHTGVCSENCRKAIQEGQSHAVASSTPTGTTTPAPPS